MSDGLGFGAKRLIEKIVETHWGIKDPNLKQFTFTELLFIMQEFQSEEGKAYQEQTNIHRGHYVFKEFVKLVLYRNLANYDSMVLLSSEKGCLTDDTLIEMPRDLKKYPKGIPIKDLIDKGPIMVYSFNPITKKIELKKCDGVEFAKKTDVYEIEFNNGIKIRATEDHPFMLMDGTMKQVKDFVYKNKKGKPCIALFLNGIRTLTDRFRLITRPNFDSNNMFKIDYNDVKKEFGDTVYKHNMMENRFIMKELGYDIDRKVVHHINHKHWDNRIENLEILDNQSEHFKEHNMMKYAFQKGNDICKAGGYSTKKKEKIELWSENFAKKCSVDRKAYCSMNKETLSEIAKKREKQNNNSNHVRHGIRVISIKYIGRMNVYDVVNVRDNHNFIANGLVCGNTGKSSAGIMLCREWCKLIGIRFNPARHIAYSNADVMNKIDALNKFEPVLCDEAVLFATAAEWAKCLSGDTLIKTPNGDIKIKDLLGQKNFNVFSFNEKTNKVEVKKAEECVYTKDAELYEIELENGKKIKATKEHMFLTKNGWKELQELNESSMFISLKNKYCKIKKIKKIGIEKTYDIVNVKDNDNFILSNNIISHNSSNKELKKKLAQIRTKHLLFVLCFPMKIQKIESVYLDSYTNYWIDLFGRGIGAVYVKDRNPAHDAWRIKDFQKLGSYTEFTSPSQVEKVLKKHPNFWQIIKFPKPPDWLYKRYLKVREKNVYDDQNVLKSVSKEDIHRALLIMALRDIMMHDTTLSMNRIILHIKNEYDINITKGMVQAAVDDAKQLVSKVREQALEV